MSYKLSFIGVGNMAKAILRGILTSDHSPVSQVYLYDVHPEQFEGLLGPSVSACATLVDAVTASDFVLLAVKPQNYDEVLTAISRIPCSEEKCYISIGAGIPVSRVSAMTGTPSVIRVLPNVPMLIGRGVSLICRNQQVSDKEFSFVRDVFSAAGSVMEIDESDMNAMIGVTSSSPAYVFRFIDAMVEGALAQGLPSEGLLEAVCDVVVGSALMLKESADTPSELVSKVASKGGTTEQALLSLDRGDFDKVIANAMKACTERADELGRLE